MRARNLTSLITIVTLTLAWVMAEVAVASYCRWSDMDPSETGTQELVDYGTAGCGGSSFADYNNIYGCPCGMTVAITVDVQSAESWSIQSTDPSSNEHNIEARDTGNPIENPVIIQVSGFNCGSKLVIRMVVDCANGSTNMPIDLRGNCNDMCE